MTSTQTYRELLDTKQPQLGKLDWINQLKQDAFLSFKTEGIPTKKHEAWKYIDTSNLLELPIHDHKSVSADSNETITQVINGEVGSRQARAGVEIKTLSDLTEDEVLALNKGVASNPFSYLNTAYFSDILVVKVTESQTEPLHIKLVTDSTDGSQLSHPRVYIEVKEAVEATIVIDEEMHGENRGISNRFFDINLKKDSKLHFYQDNIQASGYQFSSVHIDCYEASQLKTIAFTKDGVQSRQDIVIDIHEENVHCDLKGLLVESGDSEAYQHLLINHHVPNCESHQLFKTILTDTAQAEFSGIVYVHKKSHQTNTSQLNQNLLLSDSARVLSRPQLQIYADDVLCNHGSTIGQLNEEELFYLKSRGLDTEVAKAFLLYGFAEEIIDEISVTSLKEKLTAVIKQEIAKYANQNIFK